MLNQRDVDPVLNVTLAQNFYKKKKVARYQFKNLQLICEFVTKLMKYS